MTTEQWNNMIVEHRRALLNIIIREDIEPAQGKVILSKLDNLYGQIRIQYGLIMKEYKDIESWIYRIENKGRIQGRNDSDRKANGIIAVETFRKSDGTEVNLYKVFQELLSKKEDLESLLDIIKSKNSLVITMSGLLKIESNIVGRG